MASAVSLANMGVSLKYYLLVVVVSICFQRGLCQVTCVKDNNCKCTLDDGTKRFFDFQEISRKDQPNFQVGTESSLDYYDPCQPFTIAEAGDTCDGVAACHAEVGEQTSTYTKVALHDKVIFNFNDVGENLIINYDNGESGENIVTLSVLFSCSAGVDSTMEVTASTPTAFQYLIISPYSCLQEPKKKDEGLSGGSILCIIFVVVVFVYLVGGFVFMAVAKQKSGVEAIPNYSFWIEVPGLIKDGATFSVSCVSGKGISTSSGYDDVSTPDKTEGEDAFSGGGGGGGGSGGSSSTGKTGYDAI